MYREQRNYENLNKAMFAGVGLYDIPQIKPVQECTVDGWLSFNYAKSCQRPKGQGLHFFIDDYQFVRVWTHPDKYLGILGLFDVVLTPDFSTYTDFPKAVQIYNHYRKHWLGAYWQRQGMRVIPTISWSDEESFEWCFDGEPVGGVVAISTVGTQADEVSRAYFKAGYDEMIRRLQPSKVIVYGALPAEVTEDVLHIEPFQSGWKKR